MREAAGYLVQLRDLYRAALVGPSAAGPALPGS